MKNLLIILSFLLLITLIGCGKNIPKAGSGDTGFADDTLLVMAVENESGNPIQYSIIFEPRNSSGNQYCWIRGRCKNIKHTFNVRGNFEIICCLRPGEYTLKEVNYSRIDRRKYTLGKLKLNEKIKIGYGDLVLLNKKFITSVGAGTAYSVAGENKLYTSILSTIDKKTIISDLSKIENFNTWKIKNQIGWESKVTFKEPVLKKTTVPSKIESTPNLQKVAQSERPETIIIPVSGIGDVTNTRKLILENTLTDELKKHFRIVPQEKYEQVLEQVFQELEYEECSEDTCIMRVQEMLQVENVFNLQVIGEGKDSQLNLKWITLDEKRNETDYCEGCNTKKLNDKVRGLVEKLVGEKK